jgi:hypothetical protein
MSKYAAKVEDGLVTQVIVGTPEWASERLGGIWVGSDTKVGQGWQVVEGQIVPPPAPEPVEGEDFFS